MHFSSMMFTAPHPIYVLYVLYKFKSDQIFERLYINLLRKIALIILKC